MFLMNKYYVLLKPQTHSDLVSEFNSCLVQLNEILMQYNLEPASVIKETIFIKTENNIQYQKNYSTLLKLLKEFYHNVLPPTSIVAQTPENQQKCVIELTLLNNKSEEVELIRKKIDDISYSVIKYSGIKEVYAGGLTSNFNSYTLLECAKNAFKLMERILKIEKLTMGNVVRQWNYIEGILNKKSTKGGFIQNYQIFNDVRSLYYSKNKFTKGYPASTGIGTNSGGIILDFIAINYTRNVRVIPIKNPRQKNAYSYSDSVLIGEPIEKISRKTSPKFERAKYLSINNVGHVYISGTAAIIGQKSAWDQDAKNQTIITIENIQKLISKSNLMDYNIPTNLSSPKLSYLRVYVKEEQDMNDVKTICNKYFPDVPTLYLISDICRDDLLVELEGITEWF